MKRTPFLLMLLPGILVFSGCKKELDNGGISFSFVSTRSYQYTSITGSVSRQQYGNPVAQLTSHDVKKSLEITGIAPGQYHWDCRIDYTFPQGGGSYSFEGDIIIEKGKTMHITVED